MSCETPDIVVIWRGAPEALPPLVDLIRRLSLSGRRVLTLCGTISETNRTILNEAGVQIDPLGIPSDGYESLVCKANRAMLFRRAVWRRVSRLRGGPLLWIVNAETAIVLGQHLLSHKFVLQLYELPESAVKRRLLRSYVTRAVRIITPQRDRSALLRAWYKLETTPCTIRNNCHVPVRAAQQELEDRSLETQIRHAAGRRRIALYQGMICGDRDLTGIARAFSRRRDSWQLVLMGQDYGHLGRVRQENPAALHVPHLNSPAHLAVTSWASLGILAYGYDSLNNLYCAPSKLCEYAAFGLPMIASDVPALKDTIETKSAGLCCDLLDETQVSRALGEIEGRYGALRAGSLALYADLSRDTSVVELADSILGRRCGQSALCG